MACRVLVQAADFDAGAELRRLGARAAAGGVASFVGIVRSDEARPVQAMVLEHYPGMSEAAIGRIVADAVSRFSLLGCTVIHRFGRLEPGDQIMFAGAAAGHRGDALRAVEFLMDWLKTRAPFWKQEISPDGVARWVEARGEDDAAAARWTSD